MRCIVRAGALPAAVGDDQIGGHADEKARGDQIEAKRAIPVTAHPGPDLTDHVKDRAAGERVEEELERGAN